MVSRIRNKSLWPNEPHTEWLSTAFFVFCFLFLLSLVRFCVERWQWCQASLFTFLFSPDALYILTFYLVSNTSWTRCNPTRLLGHETRCHGFGGRIKSPLCLESNRKGTEPPPPKPPTSPPFSFSLSFLARSPEAAGSRGGPEVHERAPAKSPSSNVWEERSAAPAGSQRPAIRLGGNATGRKCQSPKKKKKLSHV